MGPTRTRGGREYADEAESRARTQRQSQIEIESFGVKGIMLTQ